jgi:hypothetical protein
MFEGQSQPLQAEVTVVEKRERVVTETAATAVRTERLAMVELATARAEVEVATTTDASRVAGVELEALRGNSTSSSVSANGGTDDELKLARETTREKIAQWATAHPQGCGGCSPDGRGHVSSGSPDRRRRAGGWVDGDHDLYRRHDSPSSDRYHGLCGIQTIVRDVSPAVGGLPSPRPTTLSGSW